MVSELSLLLTGGRLNARSSALIEWVYDEVAACPSYTGDWDGTKFCRDGWPSGEADALRMAEQLMPREAS